MSTIISTYKTQNGLKAHIQRHPVVALYVIMFAIAWSVMIPQSLYSQGLLQAPLPGFLEILTGWAPAIAAITVSAFVAGGAGIRRLLRRFLIWRVGLGWYLVGIFLLAALILGGIGLHILSDGSAPVLPAAGNPLWDIALTFTIFVLLGFLINTEEIAWRGFALQQLQSRYGPLAAALLIAIPEVTLHLPLFWIQDSFIQTVGVGWFSAFSVAVVFIYTYVFNSTKGSLLIVTLLHASQNAWSNLLSDNSPGPFHFTVILTWIISIGLIVFTRGHLGYRTSDTDIA